MLFLLGNHYCDVYLLLRKKKKIELFIQQLKNHRLHDLRGNLKFDNCNNIAILNGMLIK